MGGAAKGAQADGARAAGLAGWLRGHWQMLLLAALVVALWRTPVVLPLRLLVVFGHELAHALAALATGGEVLSLTLDLHEAGATLTRGGAPVVIVAAGYPGSLLLGLAVLLAAARSRLDRWVMAGLAAGMGLVALLWVRDGVALAFVIALAVALAAAARWLPAAAVDFLLRIIGLTSILYVPLDIWDDAIARDIAGSDAAVLASLVGGSARLWGAVWLALALGAIWLALGRGLGARSNLAWPAAARRGQARAQGGSQDRA